MHGRWLTVLAVATALLAIATDSLLLLRLAYVLGGVVLLSAAVAWSSVRWLDITRQTRARRAEVGGLCEEALAARNRAWLPKLWVEILDQSDLPGHRVSRVVSGLGPGRARSWNVRTPCRRRGLYTLGPMVLAGGDPLGLFRFERDLPHSVPFIVYPRTVPLRGLDIPSGFLSGGQVVRRRAQFTTANVRGVRGYQPGDAFNRIHWRTTARRGRLYTKEFELDPIADFWIVLDLQREVHVGAVPPEPAGPAVLGWQDLLAPRIDPTTEEYAVTIAASLARRFLDVGKSVGLVAYGQRRLVLQPDRGERQVTKILSSLAVLRAVGQPGLAQVLSTESHEFTRHTTVVCVTPATTLRWVEALRELRHRGVVSQVFLVEAGTFGPAGSSDGVLAALVSHAIPVRVVRNGDDLGLALAS